MITRYLPQPILAVWLAIFLLISLLLAACGGAVQPVTEEADTSAVVDEATDIQPDTEEVEEAAEVEGEAIQDQEATATDEEVPAAEEAETTQDEDLLTAGSTSEAECQPVEIPENQLIAAVSDNDWVKGPADAPMTVVEYGDFQ